ncbi:MAG: hypothetical protein VX294_09975 [Candidatus Latescibacterota bacterium]|nr:hypothetical protein [Candidatus Latescibacterota bacterium]
MAYVAQSPDRLEAIAPVISPPAVKGFVASVIFVVPSDEVELLFVWSLSSDVSTAIGSVELFGLAGSSEEHANRKITNEQIEYILWF